MRSVVSILDNAQRAERVVSELRGAGFAADRIAVLFPGRRGAQGPEGALTDAILGMGLPESEAQRYAGRLARHHILIAVHTDDGDQREIVEGIFEKAGARDIGTTGEAKRA
jgi:hypothetical protein